jgi:nucleoside 2-deoxyribosyltransferase
MVHKTVYLAGPISGLTYNEASKWRDYATEKLKKDNISGLSPLRSAVHLRNHKGLLTDCEIIPGLECAVQAMSNPKGVVTRDKFDATHCDVLLINLIGAKKVSIGTCVEIGWASANNIPIVLIMEEDNIHNHAFVTEPASFVTNSIDDALHVVQAILADY